AFGQHPQRFEAAGTRIVVLHEISVHLDLVEQDFLHRVVTAGAHEGGFIIAAAQMHGDGHVGGDVRHRGVDEIAVKLAQAFGIFGVRLVCACTNLKCSIIGWPENPSLPVTRTPSLRVVTPANAMPVSMTWRSTPSRPQRKSRCHQERRNSPSVTACSPTSSCFLITRSISRSSTALSSAAPIS